MSGIVRAVFGPEIPEMLSVGLKRKNREFCNDDDESVSDSDTSFSLSDFPKETITPQLTRWGTIPRLLKQDIRRSFGQALVNVINSHDRRLVGGYGRQFFLPMVEIQFPDEYVPVVSPIVPFGNIIRGREAWILHVKQLCVAVPDLVARLSNYRIRRWDTTKSSQVIFHLHMEGNSIQRIKNRSEISCSSSDKVHMEESFDDYASDIVGSSTPTSSSGSTFAARSIDSADSESSIGLLISEDHTDPVCKTRRFRVDVEITLHLDELMCVSRITQRALIPAEKPLSAGF